MNASAFSDLLGQLPGDMLVSAFQNAMPDSHAADDSPAHALPVPQQRAKAPADSISVPRWFTAAALAACMLFAVGVGAVLLRGHPDDMTTQSSQDDSAAVTAVYTETAEHLTQTAASASAAKPPETVTAAVSGTAEPAETAPQETESAETEPQDTEPDETASPVTETEAALTGPPAQTEPDESEAPAETTVQTEPAEPVYRMGDVNRDGEITEEDAIYALREFNYWSIAWKEHFLDGEQIRLGDINGALHVSTNKYGQEREGRIDILDAQLILFYCNAYEADAHVKDIDIVEWCRANYPDYFNVSA